MPRVTRTILEPIYFNLLTGPDLAENVMMREELTIWPSKTSVCQPRLEWHGNRIRRCWSGSVAC
jgi:hypothetical protein